MEDALEKKEKPILSVDNLEVVYNEVILVLRGISMNVSTDLALAQYRFLPRRILLQRLDRNWFWMV